MSPRQSGRVTISTIAERAGVSKVAVSYALNGRPGVSEATRANIRAIAAELGWSPNAAARSLSGGSTGAIGMVLTRPARMLGLEPFFMEFISGIQGALADRSIALLLQVVPSIEAEIAVYERWWGTTRVDGVVVTDMRTNDPRVPVLERLGLPAVVAASDPEVAGRLASVWSDDDAAMADTVRHLAALGHRRIARVGGIPELAHCARRTEAFRRTVAELRLGRPLVVDTDFSGEQGARATRRLLTRPNPPTAIVFDNDLMAVAGLGVANELGIEVPGRLSLVAWDDSMLCRLTHPPLSALRSDVAALGAEVAAHLLEIIDGAEPSSRRSPAPELSVRGSSGTAPATT